MQNQIIDYIQKHWKEHRNNSDKRNAFAVNRYIFPQIADMLSDCEDIAYISICETEDCVEYNHEEDNSHYLLSGENILNLEFDDIEYDIEQDGYHFHAISNKQAEQIYSFIEKHLDKHIICHCRAGHSRSIGVVKYILDIYPDYYEYCEINALNPIATPNYSVVTKLKQQYRKYNQINE